MSGVRMEVLDAEQAEKWRSSGSYDDPWVACFEVAPPLCEEAHTLVVHGEREAVRACCMFIAESFSRAKDDIPSG